MLWVFIRFAVYTLLRLPVALFFLLAWLFLPRSLHRKMMARLSFKLKCFGFQHVDVYTPNPAGGYHYACKHCGDPVSSDDRGGPF